MSIPNELAGIVYVALDRGPNRGQARPALVTGVDGDRVSLVVFVSKEDGASGSGSISLSGVRKASIGSTPDEAEKNGIKVAEIVRKEAEAAVEAAAAEEAAAVKAAQKAIADTEAAKVRAAKARSEADSAEAEAKVAEEAGKVAEKVIASATPVEEAEPVADEDDSDESETSDAKEGEATPKRRSRRNKTT